jgi:hypothetical protein
MSRQTDRLTTRQIKTNNPLLNRQVDRWKERCTYKWLNTNRPTDRLASRLTDRQAEVHVVGLIFGYKNVYSHNSLF